MTSESPVIGVVRDSSFWFYYPENIEDLTRLGATIVEVNSLRDRELPEIDALYIGGGFPETHAAGLAANESFRTSLRRAIDNGLPVYAECGGLMYLGRSLIFNDSEYPMVGTFPVSFTVEKRPQGHGYTVLEVDGVNPYFAAGAALRGHEFHYSKPVAVDLEHIVTVFANKRGSGFYNHRDGLVKKNTLATYSHLHSSGEGGWAGALMHQALSYQILRRRSFALGNRETQGIGVNLLRPAEISGVQH
jgi:cobyrinic acid a,c-diamide synthase